MHCHHHSDSHAISVVHVLSPSFMCCPHHSCAVPVVHVLSPLFMCCPRYSCAVPIIHVLSPLFMCCPHHSCAVPIVHVLSCHLHAIPSFTHHPIIHMPSLLFTCHSCCSRAILVVHVPSLLFTCHPCCSRAILVVHVPSLLFTCHPCCSCVILVVHVPSPSCESTSFMHRKMLREMEMRSSKMGGMPLSDDVSGHTKFSYLRCMDLWVYCQGYDP